MLTILFSVTCLLSEMNARLNEVSFEITHENYLKQNKSATDFDCILVGDMFLDNELVDMLLPWLQQACVENKKVYIGDPGRILFRAMLEDDDIELLEDYPLSSETIGKQGFMLAEVHKFCVKLNRTTTEPDIFARLEQKYG